MGHRKWSFGSAPAAEASLKELEREHGELYDELRASERRVMETLDENNRLDRELDEARKRIAELEAPTRVPFSDAQIERMAKAYYEARWDTGKWARLSPNDQASTKSAIRAALAAGGLEPCAVPEYEPDEVALAPTGTVLRDGLVEAERKVENQRMSLRQMHEARERDARLIAELRAEVDEDNAAAASVNDLLIQVQNLTAERDAQEIELADLRFYQREFAAVSAELAALRERANVPQPSSNTGQLPPADQVEALARVLREASTGNKNNQPAAGIWIKEARAAIAHLNTRPEGLPTMRDLREIGVHAYLSHDSAKRENAGCMVDPMGAATDAILTVLRPWLRDPVGCEMDVTAEEYKDMRNRLTRGGNWDDQLDKEYDWLRSRIRPVFECKECAARAEAMMRPQPVIRCAMCAEWEKDCRALSAASRSIDARIAARAALEGE